MLTLALGIGVNTAMFSVLDRILLGTLPVPNPHELVFLYHPGPVHGRTSSDEGGGAVFSYPMFRALQTDQTTFTGLAGAREQSGSLAYGDQATLAAAPGPGLHSVGARRCTRSDASRPCGSDP